MHEILLKAFNEIGDPSGLLDSGKQFIEGKFGPAGLIAALLLLIGIAALILAKVTKLSFDIIRYVAVPSVAITFIATYFLPFSFVYILPVTVAFFSIVLMVKG